MTQTQPPYRLSHRHSDRIVLVGASIRAAAESAQRAGFLVIGVDLFGDTDTRAACDQFFQIPSGPIQPGQISDNRRLNEILKSCSNLPVLSVGGLNGYQSFIDQLSIVGDPVGVPRSIQIRLQEPSQLALIAGAAGVQVPRSYVLGRETNSMAMPETARLLRKQCYTSGGLGVQWLASSLSDSDPNHPKAEIISQWVPGRSYGVSFLSDGVQAIMIGICRSLFTRKGNCPFVYAGSLGPISVSQGISERLNRLGQAVVDSLSIQGLFNADVVIDRAHQVWLLEINPRWSGSSELIERSLRFSRLADREFSLLGCMLNSTELSGFPLHSNAPRQRYLKRILFARVTSKFCLARVRGFLDSNQSLHDIPQDGILIQRGEPVMTLITKIDPDDRNSLGSYRAFRKRVEHFIE